MNLKYSKMMMKELHEYRPAYYRAVLLLTLGIRLGIGILHFLVPGYFCHYSRFFEKALLYPLDLDRIALRFEKDHYFAGPHFFYMGLLSC